MFFFARRYFMLQQLQKPSLQSLILLIIGDVPIGLKELKCHFVQRCHWHQAIGRKSWIPKSFISLCSPLQHCNNYPTSVTYGKQLPLIPFSQHGIFAKHETATVQHSSFLWLHTIILPGTDSLCAPPLSTASDLSDMCIIEERVTSWPFVAAPRPLKL